MVQVKQHKRNFNSVTRERQKYDIDAIDILDEFRARRDLDDESIDDLIEFIDNEYPFVPMKEKKRAIKELERHLKIKYKKWYE